MRLVFYGDLKIFYCLSSSYMHTKYFNHDYCKDFCSSRIKKVIEAWTKPNRHYLTVAAKWSWELI